jgi:hypothetical protein
MMLPMPRSLPLHGARISRGQKLPKRGEVQDRIRNSAGHEALLPVAAESSCLAPD